MKCIPRQEPRFNLKSCPKCKSNLLDISVFYADETYQTPWKYQITCRKCAFGGPTKKSEPDAIQAWNNIERD